MCFSSVLCVNGRAVTDELCVHSYMGNKSFRICVNVSVQNLEKLHLLV